MPSADVVDLSRLQFAVTALYHFLFVPLTLGLSWILVIMESVYVMTGKVIYRDMTKFWGKLFGINFVMGVATGLTLEFHSETGGDPHCEVDAEQLAPELRHVAVDLLSRHHINGLHDDQYPRQSQRQWHEQEVIERGDRELQPRQFDDFSAGHGLLPYGLRGW